MSVCSQLVWVATLWLLPVPYVPASVAQGVKMSLIPQSDH